MTEDELLATAKPDLSANLRRPVALEVEIGTLMQLIALLQLACRHPGVSDGVRLTAEQFVDGCGAGFQAQGLHGLAALVRAGWRAEEGAL